MSTLSNTLFVTADLVDFKSTHALARRANGRGSGEFVPTARQNRDLPSDEEDENDDSEDSDDDNGMELDEDAHEELQARVSEGEDGSGSDEEDTVRTEAQCTHCLRWAWVSTQQTARVNHGDFYCNASCRLGLSVVGMRPKTASAHHDDYCQKRLHDASDGRVQQIEIAKTKVEQNVRNVLHRVGLLEEGLETKGHVADLSEPGGGTNVVFGQGASTMKALLEVRTGIGYPPTAASWQDSDLPPVVNLALVGNGGFVVRTVNRVATAVAATPNEEVEGCLAVEAAIEDWKALDIESKISMARFLVRPTTKTSGMAAQTTCLAGINGVGGLACHTDCPVCGIDRKALPAGVAVPLVLPARQRVFALDPGMLTQVEVFITSQVCDVLDRDFPVKDCDLGKAMALHVTGETVRTAMELKSTEWMCFIDGAGNGAGDGAKNMEKELLNWLRRKVEAAGSAKWQKAQLLLALRDQSAELPAYKKGDSVYAHWMVTDPAKQGGVKVDPTEQHWLQGEIVGKVKGKQAFKVLFLDGHTHPGVPLAHIRRLV